MTVETDAREKVAHAEQEARQQYQEEARDRKERERQWTIQAVEEWKEANPGKDYRGDEDASTTILERYSQLKAEYAVSQKAPDITDETPRENPLFEMEEVSVSQQIDALEKCLTAGGFALRHINGPTEGLYQIIVQPSQMA
jgi:hypothetical protein|tara:strand:- start:1679 stop:2101 length:423 start_codon:yes stop_codon:yes gene_type:complete